MSVSSLDPKGATMSTITTTNPASEKEIQTYDVMTEKEVTDRVEACHAAFLEWRELTHPPGASPVS